MIYVYEPYVFRVTDPLDAGRPAQVFRTNVLCK
jgi:hypothetical protein